MMFTKEPPVVGIINKGKEYERQSASFSLIYPDYFDWDI